MIVTAGAALATLSAFGMIGYKIIKWVQERQKHLNEQAHRQ